MKEVRKKYFSETKPYELRKDIVTGRPIINDILPYNQKKIDRFKLDDYMNSGGEV